MYLNAFFFEHTLNTSCEKCFMVVELHFFMIFLYFSGIDCIKHIWSNALIFVLCIFYHCCIVLNSLVSKLYKSLKYINPLDIYMLRFISKLLFWISPELYITVCGKLSSSVSTSKFSEFNTSFQNKFWISFALLLMFFFKYFLSN